MKRRKAVKDSVILIRATEAQKEAFADAAEEAGLTLSGWMLSIALRELKKLAKEG